MAKIYETKEDVERDRLANNIATARANESSTYILGTLGAVSGLAVLADGLGDHMKQKAAIREVKKIAQNITKEDSVVVKLSRLTRIGKWAKLAFGAVAGVIGVTSFVISSKEKRYAKDAESKLSQLGPQQIVVPDNTTELPKPMAGEAQYIEAGHLERLQKSRQAQPAQAQPVKS